MKESHNYEHTHNHQDLVDYKNILITLGLSVLFSIVEVIGVLVTGSAALMSSFIHDSGDVIILGATVGIEKFSAKERNNKFTFGYRRFTLVASILNLLVLLIGSVSIVIISFGRVLDPPVINENGAILITIMGIFVNYAGYRILKKSDGVTNEQLQLNIKSDIYSWSLMLIANLLIKITGAYVIDPLFSLILGLYIGYEAINNAKEIFNMLMQAVPDDINLENVIQVINSVSGVVDVHDVHLWTLDGEDYIFTAHIAFENDLDAQKIFELKESIKIYLEFMKINHATLEVEDESHFNNLGQK